MLTISKVLHFVFAENAVVTPLARKAALRTHQAFRPKTRQAYDAMFRVFVAFCIVAGVLMSNVNVEVVMSFLECMVQNHCSCAVLENYMSAIKANFVLYDLPFLVFDHPKIKYFIRSIKINRPLSLRPHNTIDLSTLKRISRACLDLPHGLVYRAVFLIGFFAFFRLSNLAPHSLSSFDASRHLTGHDVFFTKKLVKVLIKWSKTIQQRDTVQCITLPKLRDRSICPFSAIKELLKLYPMSPHTSLFQIPNLSGFVPLTDSRIRKSLQIINKKLGFHSAHFTFHDFRRSGATFAFNAQIPIQAIKRHGTWSSNCVWRYIQSDHSSGDHIANALASVINNA